MNTKPADEMSDVDLAEAVETLAAFARKYLPEGYVLRLECSQHDDRIQLFWSEDQDSPIESVDIAGTLSAYTDREGWGFACDAANLDAKRRMSGEHQ